jgi:hypothetical protein
MKLIAEVFTSTANAKKYIVIFWIPVKMIMLTSGMMYGVF